MKRALSRAGFAERQYTTGGVTLSYVAGPALGSTEAKAETDAKAAPTPDRRLPLVLFPGQTQPWQSYTRVLPALARHFQVYACDVHGHGRSSFRPDRYSFNAIGEDFAAFLRDVVGRPALLSGNSSGGLIATWLAANAPEQVLGVLAEDPPLFSSEWPRLQSCFVREVMELAIEKLADAQPRDVPGFFSHLAVPTRRGSRVTLLAGPFLKVIALYIRLMQTLRPSARAISLPLMPFPLRMAVLGFSGYDPEFSRPFLDGRFGRGFDHAQALARIRCPYWLLHANWFESDEHGLVGAMTDADVARAQDLVPRFHAIRLASGHVIHQEKPRRFVTLATRFAQAVTASTGPR